MNDLNGLSIEQLRDLFAPEIRTVAVPLTDFEYRASQSGDGSRILTGYAAVYEQEAFLYSGSRWTLRERITTGAFNNVLTKNPDVHLTIGHDMTKAIARTGISGIGGLELRSDAHGLRVYARLNSHDPDVQSLTAKMDLRIMDQMSFSFRILPAGSKHEITTDEHGHETELRIITEIAELFDVCVCARGSYTQTSASLRTLLANITVGAETVSGKLPVRSKEVPADGVGVATTLVDHQHYALLMRAKMAANKFKGENQK
ncbi:MAG: hypothetical protein DDT39_01234 [Firmicutes bacterium]|nr:hypothetical protein [candidate division NPL-UPA2 bacterium]